MKIVIATPHQRHDALVSRLEARAGIQVKRIREAGELTLGSMEAFQPRYVFFPHWSWKIPADVHEAYECVIFHMTDVPYGRGGSPLQNLIVRGHKETKLSALRCVAEMDAGPVYMKAPLSLVGTAEDILRRAAAETEKMIWRFIAEQPQPIPQTGEVVAFKRRRPADGSLAPLSELEKAYDYIRMLDGEGYPPAFIETEHFHIDFTDARCEGGSILANAKITLKTKE